MSNSDDTSSFIQESLLENKESIIFPDTNNMFFITDLM